ncbi:type II secretion system protein [bacterium]|uniref:Type II secretion system protein GspG C-terminal domain-containing protein n=1 Tax=candidate division WWE3 bacterium CG22_combo_CG10-13_8_21_14_all_39_12 TaxID=1975094 RepID=A0A2H0BH37_UNCKA|nr:type II secretion system protein [bacterium]PIP56961.1 MAG: hypothetical protein COX05_00270 [candidate division WWE3 bacterium CG22_combo_CG10-13_8_21_14_all_39_12]
MRTTPEQGFTLIELLVVIAVIGILQAVLLLTLDPKLFIKKANDNNRKVGISQIIHEIEVYMVTHDQKPPEGGYGTGILGGKLYSYDYSFAQGNASYPNSFLEILKADGSVKTVPVDPQNGPAYNGPNPYYVYYQNVGLGPNNSLIQVNDSYVLWAYLENTEDKQCIQNVSGATYISNQFGEETCLYVFENGEHKTVWD